MITVITSYEIKRESNEEILYLSFDFSDEFSKFNFKEKTQKLERIVKDFINKNRINFNGTKVAIVIGGIAVGTLFLNNTTPSTNNFKIDNNNITIMENVNNFPILNDMNHSIEAEEQQVIQSDIMEENNIPQENIQTSISNINQEVIENVKQVEKIEDNGVFNSVVNEQIEQYNPVTEETTKTEEVIEEQQYNQETTFEAKPSLWQRIKNLKFIRTIRYLMKIKVVLELPALPEGKMEEQHQH